MPRQQRLGARLGRLQLDPFRTGQVRPLRVALTSEVSRYFVPVGDGGTDLSNSPEPRPHWAFVFGPERARKPRRSRFSLRSAASRSRVCRASVKRTWRSVSPSPRPKAVGASTTGRSLTSSPHSKKRRPPGAYRRASTCSPLQRYSSSMKSATCQSAPPRHALLSADDAALGARVDRADIQQRLRGVGRDLGDEVMAAALIDRLVHQSIS